MASLSVCAVETRSAFVADIQYGSRSGARVKDVVRTVSAVAAAAAAAAAYWEWSIVVACARCCGKGHVLGL
jgi:hypothetical protein